MMSPFEALLSYHPQMFYEDNHDPRSKSQFVDENAVALRDLMKELKMNLTESQELQTLYHNKHIKERIYRLGKSVWLSGKHIKLNKISNLSISILATLRKWKQLGSKLISSSYMQSGTFTLCFTYCS